MKEMASCGIEMASCVDAGTADYRRRLWVVQWGWRVAEWGTPPCFDAITLALSTCASVLHAHFDDGNGRGPLVADETVAVFTLHYRGRLPGVVIADAGAEGPDGAHALIDASHSYLTTRLHERVHHSAHDSDGILKSVSADGRRLVAIFYTSKQRIAAAKKSLISQRALALADIFLGEERPLSLRDERYWSMGLTTVEQAAGLIVDPSHPLVALLKACGIDDDIDSGLDHGEGAYARAEAQLWRWAESRGLGEAALQAWIEAERRRLAEERKAKAGGRKGKKRPR